MIVLEGMTGLPRNCMACPVEVWDVDGFSCKQLDRKDRPKGCPLIEIKEDEQKKDLVD